MLLTLRIGLVPIPATGAILSIREETLAVAQNVAERDTFVARRPVEMQASLSGLVSRHPPPQQGWAPPPTVEIMKQRDEWKSAIAKTLSGNQTIANAATWLASAPLRLRVNRERIFLSIALRMP
ncbi:MAG TPA: hypothetical protein VFK85_11325 [Anaeromyxobacteraceae bacterium]|nr:hypothetical protein [Anaeromyxobacteraceae bacterium]